jgi:hypothetical protein
MQSCDFRKRISSIRRSSLISIILEMFTALGMFTVIDATSLGMRRAENEARRVLGRRAPWIQARDDQLCGQIANAEIAKVCLDHQPPEHLFG